MRYEKPGKQGSEMRCGRAAIRTLRYFMANRSLTGCTPMHRCHQLHQRRISALTNRR